MASVKIVMPDTLSKTETRNLRALSTIGKWKQELLMMSANVRYNHGLQ